MASESLAREAALAPLGSETVSLPDALLEHPAEPSKWLGARSEPPTKMTVTTHCKARGKPQHNLSRLCRNALLQGTPQGLPWWSSG